MQRVWISVWHTMLQETPGSHSNLQMITCSVYYYYYYYCYFDACLSWFLDFSSTCWDNKAQNDGNAVSCIHLVWLHHWESLHLHANSCFYCHTTDLHHFHHQINYRNIKLFIVVSYLSVTIVTVVTTVGICFSIALWTLTFSGLRHAWRTWSCTNSPHCSVLCMCSFHINSLSHFMTL